MRVNIINLSANSSGVWVLVVSMERAGPLRPPSAENVLGALTSALGALYSPPGSELIPYRDFKPEPELIVTACK